MLWNSADKLIRAGTPRMDGWVDHSCHQPRPLHLRRAQIARHARIQRQRNRRRFLHAARGRCLACAIGGMISLCGMAMAGLGFVVPAVQQRMTPVVGTCVVGGTVIFSLVTCALCVKGLADGLQRLARGMDEPSGDSRNCDARDAGSQGGVW